jgi:hypothetical protein
MLRCYLSDPKDSRPLRTRCFSTHDDDVDKVLLVFEDFNHDLDVIDDEIDAKKGTKMDVDVVGNDARCSGIGLNMRDEMGDEMGDEMSFKMVLILMLVLILNLKWNLMMIMIKSTMMNSFR